MRRLFFHASTSARLMAVIALVWLGGCTLSPPLQTLEKAQVAPPPDTISMEIDGYQPMTGRIFHNLFVSNFSVKVSRGTLLYSTARDGMSDTLKTRLSAQYGFLTTVPDSIGQGYSDLVTYMAGITSANQANLYCGSQLRFSTSNDAFTYADTRLNGSTPEFLGLRDCEKIFMQMRTTEFDNDGDGIPDYLEVREGLNPRNPADANLSISNDGVSNIDKIKRHIPIDEDANSQPNHLFAYQYNTSVDSHGTRTFQISNIPVLNSGVDNFIAMYLTETNTTSNTDTLYSAFMILHRPAVGTNIRIPFWVNKTIISGGSPTNQEILQP